MSLVSANSYSDSFNYCEMTSTWWHLNTFRVVFLSRVSMQCMQSAILLWEIGLSVCVSVRLAVCLSVCLSVSLSNAGIVSKRMHMWYIITRFNILLETHSSSFCAHRGYNSPNGTLSVGVLSTRTAVGKFCNYRLLSEKWYEIVP